MDWNRNSESTHWCRNTDVCHSFFLSLHTAIFWLLLALFVKNHKKIGTKKKSTSRMYFEIKNLLSVLENKSEKWTFENFLMRLHFTRRLLVALKACVDEKQVEENLIRILRLVLCLARPQKNCSSQKP